MLKTKEHICNYTKEKNFIRIAHTISKYHNSIIVKTGKLPKYMFKVFYKFPSSFVLFFFGKDSNHIVYDSVAR